MCVSSIAHTRFSSVYAGVPLLLHPSYVSIHFGTRSASAIDSGIRWSPLPVFHLVLVI